MKLRLGDPIDRSIYLYGLYEYRVASIFCAALSPGMTVTDVGAHHGLYTLLAANRVGIDGRVLAVEPNPATAVRLQDNIALNKFQNVLVVPSALSNRDVESLLFVPADPNLRAQASLRPDWQRDGTTTAITIAAQRLDTVLDRLGCGRLDVVKLDVEGCEVQVLEGGEMTIKRCHPPIIFEANDISTRTGKTSGPAISLLREWGYHIHGIAMSASGRCWLEPLPPGQDPRPYREPWDALNLVAIHPEARGFGLAVSA
jgi:FkbM family methyltransferase